MYVIEVIPLTVMPPQVPQLLTYFFDQALAKGAVVQVPINKKTVTAIVVSSGTLEQQKIALKKSGFQLKKITKVLIETPQVSSRQFQFALWLAKNYYAPLGMSLDAVLPPFFGKRGYNLDIPRQQLDEEPPSPTAIAAPLFIQAQANQTLSSLKPYITDTVRHNGQVLLLAPDKTVARYFFEQLKDIAPAGYISSDLSNAEYYTLWKNVAAGDCKIIVGTRSGLFLPFRDLWMIAIEDPFHEMYKSDLTPKYNTPDVAMKVGELYGARLFTVAPLPNLNITQALEHKVFEHEMRTSVSPVAATTVDTAHERRTGNYSQLSRDLQRCILQSLERSEPILLYSARRAHSSVLACKNCSAAIMCPNCDIPMRVHQTQERMLICYHCSAYQTVPTACPNCNSVNFILAGNAGSQKVQEDVQKLLAQHTITNAEVFVFDSDLIRDEHYERGMLDAIANTKKSIIIATQLLFSHRYTHQYSLIGIVNADALMSGADFRSEERFLAQYHKLLDFSPQHIVIQTYNPQSAVIAAAAQGTVAQFTAGEMPVRKTLNYPPFSRLVQLKYRHPVQARAVHTAHVLNEQLRRAIAFEKLSGSVTMIGPTPASIARERNKYVYTVLLKIKPELEHLDQILRYVPTPWEIDVDPSQNLL